MLSFRTRRSGGIRVAAGVHRLLVRGNAARDRQDWAAAATAYRAALEADPALPHIWVQLGHATKEAGDPAGAEVAYRQAVQLRPEDADPHLHLGHLFNITGDHARAGQHYLLAFQANPNLVDAATALHRAIARARGPKREALIAILREASAAAVEEAPPALPVPAGTANAITFDVSDLIGYFAHGRAPTGIQRVQIQIITHALRRPAGPVHVCCFIDGRDAWLEVPAAHLMHLVQLSLASSERDDPVWITALHRLHLQLALAPEFAFPAGSVLVNLGSSWQLPNYFLFVRAAKARFGISYVPFVHDLIPIVAPAHFVKAARQEVVPWVLGVFTHADHMLVNSEATKRDLVAVAGMAGRTLNPDGIAVIRLDADFRTVAAAVVPPAAEPFVLLVSTVESRKGHATAFDAWSRLIARHGAERVPRLVCVGKRGWLSAGVYRRLEQDAALASRVTMRAAVSDAELAALYQTCQFTLYPSSYEGWGLPITEALSYGKPVIASNTSSLPEAGGSYAVYVQPGSVAALADAVARMAFDAPYREAIAARIAAEFRPRRWADLADQVQAELVRLAQRARPPMPLPTARLGAYHSVARSTALRVWPGAGVGEVFRSGTGWTSPEAEGCWTRTEGGRLAIPLPPGQGAVRVGLLLLGSPHADLDWTVQVRHGPSLAGTLRRHRRRWVTFTVTPVDDRVEAWLRAAPFDSEADSEADGDQVKSETEEALPGLAGFFVYRAEDAAAGLRLFEAIALDNLDDVDAYRLPPPDIPAPDWDRA